MWIGAILISILSILLFIIASPLGSIGGINNYGQNAYNFLGYSFDEAGTGGIACPADFLYAMLILSVFLGAVGAAMFSKEFAIRIAPKPELVKGLVGGLLMGVGGSIGMGCTISGFYSSLPALSAGGLFFGMGLFIGVFVALKYFLWESERFPSLSEGKWGKYLWAEKTKPSWQPIAGFFVLLWGVLLIIQYDPFSPSGSDLQFIGFILIGLMVGFILQRSRFCIFRAIREPFLSGDPGPAQAIISGLLVGLVGFSVIKGIGQGDEYAFIFTNFWIPGLVGGIIFGIGMTSAGACSIGSTWRAAEGNLKHLLAVIGIAISMPLSGEYLKPRFLDAVPQSAQQAEFLPDTLGYGGAVLLILFFLFLWYIILKWNEQSGILLLIGRPDDGIPWPERRDFLLVIFIAILLISGTLVFTLQHQYWDDDDGTTTDEAFQENIEEFLFSGRPTTLTAPEVHTLLTDGYSGNDPFIISLRDGSSYRQGHIPGAVNIDYNEIFTEAEYHQLPGNRLIVVYDDTGHQSAEIASLLNIMGLFAVSIEWGMAAWTPNTTIAPEFYQPQLVLNDLPLATGTEPGALTRSWYMQDVGQCGFVTPPPDVDEDDEEKLRWTILNSLATNTRSTISADDLHSSLTQSMPINDPFLLDLRSPPRYQKGHIPGAVNKDLDTMFKERDFGDLPTDGRTIVVIADSPHMASQARAYLDIFRYTATVLEYGMASWTSDIEVAPVRYDRTEDCYNFPVTVGEEAGTMETATIRGKTREDILLEAAFSVASEYWPYMNASTLAAILNDTDPGNDPLLISIQDQEEFTRGHIPMSENILPKDLFTRPFVLDLVNQNRQIVIISQDGQEASPVARFLHLLGFDARHLQYGMCGWTNDTEVIPQPLNYSKLTPLPVENSSQGYPVMPLLPPGLPWTEPEINSREWDILRKAFQGYFSDPSNAGVSIGRDSLHYDLIDDQTTNDPKLISFRWLDGPSGPRPPGAEFHILQTVFQPDFLASAQSSEPIVLVSQDGEYASMVSAMMRLNGIDSLHLRYGFDSWQYNATANLNPCIDPDSRVNDYLTEGT